MRLVVLFALSGCSSVLGIEDFKLGDAGVITGDVCFGPPVFRVCLADEPTTPTNISSALTLDTVSDPLCAPAQPASWKAAGQPDACFVIGTQIMLGAPAIQVTGARPLVIVASDTITIDTQLDVASHVGMPGPAVPSTACPAPGVAGDSGNGAGGGAGATFITRGGRGGTSSSGIAGGAAANPTTSSPMTLRAGCSGGTGGNASGQGGIAGAGGGAVYLVARNRISINGFINASGAPGGGGGTLAGGGGGGSGGMIVLHAPAISGSGGIVLANGGGGGGGGSSMASGGRGLEPVPQMPMMAASGGTGAGGVGGNGGNGFGGTTIAGDGLNGAVGAAGGGGGGGGGGGFIRSNVALSQIMQSPPAVIVP